VTGRLDALEWRVPVTGMASLAVIEPVPAPAPAAPVEITSEAPPKSDGPPSNTGQPATVADGLSSQRTDEVSQQKTESRLEPKPEPIIPLILVPDDPGPDAVEESEPHTEHESGWRKIFG
jgi:uncharacterized membrane-anchored protein